MQKKNILQLDNEKDISNFLKIVHTIKNISQKDGYS